MREFLLWISRVFDITAYLGITKIQGLLWSVADIVMILAFLLVVDILIRKQGSRVSCWRYILLFSTLLMTPFLLFTRSSKAFFLLESAIFGIQYLILLYTLIKNSRAVVKVLLTLNPSCGHD